MHFYSRFCAQLLTWKSSLFCEILEMELRVIE